MITLEFTTDDLRNEARGCWPEPIRKVAEDKDVRLHVFTNTLGSYNYDFLLFKNDETKSFGKLRFGGRHSGSIWQGYSLVGEFDKNSDGHYTVTPIHDGLKIPDSKRIQDPLQFLANLGV